MIKVNIDGIGIKNNGKNYQRSSVVYNKIAMQNYVKTNIFFREREFRRVRRIRSECVPIARYTRCRGY